MTTHLAAQTRLLSLHLIQQCISRSQKKGFKKKLPTVAAIDFRSQKQSSKSRTWHRRMNACSSVLHTVWFRKSNYFWHYKSASPFQKMFIFIAWTKPNSLANQNKTCLVATAGSCSLQTLQTQVKYWTGSFLTSRHPSVTALEVVVSHGY